MTRITRGRPLLAGCAAVGVAAVLGVSGAVAAAEPVLPAPPTPGYTPGAPVPQAATLPGVVALPSAAASGTLRDYFAEKNVQLEPAQAADFTALNITLPIPARWTRVPDPNVPDAFAVIADRQSGSLYPPNAQLVVYRLVGSFDPGEAIRHGYVNSQQLTGWRTTSESLADFGGFPSSIIEGTYRQNDMTLTTSQRHVIATTGADSYLVTLTVTVGAGQSTRSRAATSAIINGFRVAEPTTAPATEPAAPTAPVAS